MYIVYAKEVGKTVFNANNKRIQSIDSIEKYAIEKTKIYYIKMKILNVII